MIKINPSPTADTRTCDVSKVTKEQLLESSQRHIADVIEGLRFFVGLLGDAATAHDTDKITLIDWFHKDFQTGFKETGWWDNHRRITRHHIDKPDGVPSDINLIDVLEHIADCVMAGMARSGSVYELKLPDSLLREAFVNTVELLKKNVEVTTDPVTDRTVPEKRVKEEILLQVFVNTWNAVRDKANGNSITKGFWETDHGLESDLARIALMHEELSEAVSGLRHGNPPSDKIPEFTSAEEELADCVIRIMDLAGQRRWRIGEAIVAKMAYNATRPHKHGKLI